MMKHYLDLKSVYPDTIIFYRLGDFYEFFFEDAHICSRELGLTLTGKSCGLEEKAPMCGVPQKSADTYIAKLIEKGYKVGICEQLTEPTKGVKIVERDIVRIITPGTVIDTEMLDSTQNNYLASIYFDNNTVGISAIDISTGEFFVTEYADDIINNLNNYLVMLSPKEIISNSKMTKISHDLIAVSSSILPSFTTVDDSYFNFEKAQNLLLNQLNAKSLKDYNCATKMFAVMSAGALLQYIFETQKRDLSHINNLYYLQTNTLMNLDASTRRNLELLESSKDRKKKGSLYWLLDKTKTNMGSRMLRSFIEKPLFDDKIINYRLEGVNEFVKNIIARDFLREILYTIYDIERLAGKISYGNITPKDCLSLHSSLVQLPQIRAELSNFKSAIITDAIADISDFSYISDLLNRAIRPDCTNNLKEGGFIKAGYNKEIDEYENISKVGKTWLAELEATERELTGIKNLKIGYNRVFGYYIEVLHSQVDLVPFRYQRKQTISNSERYVTDELKKIEDKILNAEDRKIQLEFELFEVVRKELLNYIKEFQKTSKSIALLDVIISFAVVAVEKNYCMPKISKNNNTTSIENGRHPIVESLNREENFVPNDTLLDDKESRTMIITGPNMAGKSTYMRQVALITFMAHLGSFVPASSAKIALTDKIFTRIGASDDLAYGQSTFMVEMLEVGYILNNATNKSLIILDEVGRGTSTFDGLSIAWSVMEYLSNKLLAKTLFATHFHELTELEGTLDGVKNYKISVKEYNNSVIFLRKIVRGGASKSFGIEVASLANLPKEIINRAKEILHNLEQNELNIHSLNAKYKGEEVSISTKYNNEVFAILKDVNVDNLTPLNAFDILVDLKNKIEK